MYRKLFQCLLLLMLSATVIAGELADSDVQQIRSDITAMYKAFEGGDANKILAKTHPAIYTLVGGEKNFEAMMTQAVTKLMEADIQYLNSELQPPKRLYRAGEEEICFVPRIATYRIQGKKIKSVGFMIAVRKAGAESWRYLDGAGLRKNRELLWILFPALTRDVQLPPSYQEITE